MKKLLSILLILAPCGLFAGESAVTVSRTDRDVLLTRKGTLYTIEQASMKNPADPDNMPLQFLRLRIEHDEKSEIVNLPASMNGGVPSAPALAYDSESDTLFVFWQKQPNRMSSELLLCSFRDGAWGPVTSIENAAFHLRSNLRIGVTRLTQRESEAGSTSVPGLAVHAIWWDESAYGESARYAMLSMEMGAVRTIEIRDLIELAGEPAKIIAGPMQVTIGRESLRHPAIFESPLHDSVDVIFADMERDRIHRINIRPVVQDDGYIRLPVGRHRRSFDVPQRLANDANIVIVAGSNASNLLFFSKTDKGLEYLLHTESGWSDPKLLKFTDGISKETGADVLRKMMASE